MDRNTRLTTLAACCLGAGAIFGLGLYVGSGSADVGGYEVVPVQEGMGDMDPATMMEMWAQASTPGEEHKAMHAMLGEWQAQTKNLMPGMDAFESTGTATFTMSMNDRFVRQDFKGDVMGMEMHGVSITGYNKPAGRYESVWFDNMNTAMSHMTGRKTETGWVYEGQETDPMSGQILPIRDLITIHGEDHFSFERQYPAEAMEAQGMPVPEGAEWVGGFRVTYTR